MMLSETQDASLEGWRYKNMKENIKNYKHRFIIKETLKQFYTIQQFLSVS